MKEVEALAEQLDPSVTYAAVYRDDGSMAWKGRVTVVNPRLRGNRMIDAEVHGLPTMAHHHRVSYVVYDAAGISLFGEGLRGCDLPEGWEDKRLPLSDIDVEPK